MEPRSYERGYQANAAWCSPGQSLQWSRALTNADISIKSNLALTGWAASMEPRSYERGYVEVIIPANYAPGASMEPRSYERGYAGNAGKYLLLHAASMEPRSYERGYTALKGRHHQRDLLQWSRALTNADI